MLDPSAGTLLVVATYNERENVEVLYQQVKALGLELDLLFVDDNSPDGTGLILDAIAREDAHVRVLHRAGKQGVGSAHLAGIRYAYAHGYRTLLTMDADLTHSPSLLPRFLDHAGDTSLVVGSRYILAGSIADWDLLRRFITRLGHLLTSRLLGVPYDATGALRLYRLDQIPAAAFNAVTGRGYEFFFESLFVLCQQGVRVGEIPIPLPKRAYGHSKMTRLDVLTGLNTLLRLSVRRRARSFASREHQASTAPTPTGEATPD